MSEASTLMVHGVNCNSCKKALAEALEGFEVERIETKAETGVHPNKLVVKGELTAIKQAIAKLDAGRGKFTVEEP